MEQHKRRKIDPSSDRQDNHNFNLLPDDIWLCIISHVKDFLDLSHLAQVNKCLNMLVNDYYRRLRTISFNYYISNSLEFQDLEPLLKRMPNLIEADFSIDDKKSITKRIGQDEHRLLTNNCKNLTCLNLTRISFASSELVSIVTQCDRITKLILDYARLDNEEELTQVMEVCRNRLLHLSMKNIQVYSPGSIDTAHINEYTTGVYCLRSLAMQNAELYDLNFVLDCPDLEQLSIEFTINEQESWIRNGIGEIIKGCTKLKLLNGLSPTYAANSDIELFLNLYNFHDEISDTYYSEEEIDKMEQLSELFHDCWLWTKKEYLQEFIPVIYGPVIEVLEGEETFNYAKIKKSSMHPLFVSNAPPGTRIQLIYEEGESSIDVEGIVLSKEDFYTEADYDESFMYIVASNRASRFCRELFRKRWNYRENEFRLVNIALQVALESTLENPGRPHLLDEQRILSDGFIRDLLLLKQKRIESRNLLSYVDLNKVDDMSSNLNDNQNNIIRHALTHRITLIPTTPEDSVGDSLTIVPLVHHLFQTRSFKDSKILICAADNNTLDILAIKIHEMNKLRVVNYQPECFGRQNGKPYDLAQRLQEMPRNFPGIQSNIITVFEYFRLDEQTRDDWRDYQALCVIEVVQEAQVLCCTFNNASILINKDRIKFDSVIIIDNSDKHVFLSEVRMIIQHLPRRIVLFGNGNRLTPVDEVRDASLQEPLFTKLQDIGIKPLS